MSKKVYIKKIVRDDGEYLEFDQTEIYLDQENTLMARPEIETTAVEYTEADGGEMVAQRLASGEQTINGLIIPKTSTFWALRNKLTSFFKPNQTYFIVYEKISGEQFTVGEMFKTGTAWIEENLQVPPEPYEDYAKWSVTLKIGSAYYQEYAEDDSGEETFANSVTLALESNGTGGQEWDSEGDVWDSEGDVWEDGNGGIQEVYAETADTTYPTWVVTDTATNPTLENITTGETATYTGTVNSTQTLTVDFAAGTAYLDSTNVSANLSGSITLENGTNRLAFNIDDGTAETSTLKWNNLL